MRKLILHCGLSPGDIVMLTAAVRDLHECYPGNFATDVRTRCPEIWENNPYVTQITDDDPEAERIDCSYPLINWSNHAPYHCLHGFIDFLNERLQLRIKPRIFRGDIHLSAQEKAWYSQVHELTGENIPFWIIAAGGKYDITVKWWETIRYQEVVNRFQGKILFVQVGQSGHFHPRLRGVVDLRGKTTLRELIRLVYHAQGVLCPVTSLMHLAAAVEVPRGRFTNRACVVVAGGREPAHWEAYPDHQYIHTNGLLRCCANGGCWKDRTFRLNDGDERDRPDHLCTNAVNGLPRCMDMITANEVIRRIRLYFEGGVTKYVTKRRLAAARRAIDATAHNSYDRQPLNLHTAGMQVDRFIETIPSYPPRYEGRGIVICAGGVKYFTNAWVCINLLRQLGCGLPIEVWHIGEKEMGDYMKSLLRPLGVECVDGQKLRRKYPIRHLHGWELKPYAIVHSRFQEILLLDADNVPLVDPEFLFDTPHFERFGAIFWPDFGRRLNVKATPIWKSCGLRQPGKTEFESGQIVVHKKRCWRALRLALWFNEHSDFYYGFVHGDKETFHLAFRKLKQRFVLVPIPIHPLRGTMCQHDFSGRRIFQHRNMRKWNLRGPNATIDGFRLDAECRAYLAQLRRIWDGKVS